jgi:uncharacterized membrane protein (UPF0127 family)
MFAAALWAMTGCGDDGIEAPATVVAGSTTDVTPVGFELDSVTLTTADGETDDLAVWIADTVEARGRGLMEVTDLGDAEGMLFVFEEERSPRFYMWQTPMALDIAFFAANGAFVDAASMDPCLEPPVSACARYSPSAPALLALEVPAGSLADLGVGPGTVLTRD